MKRDYLPLRLYCWPIGIPESAFAGLVQGNQPRSARTIPVQSNSSRWPTFGEVVYIGSAAGKYDIGIARVISSSQSGGTVTICENEMQLPNGAVLTAPWLFAPTVRLQRIVESGGNPVVYKDYDIAFDPSKYLPPKANLSGPVSGKVGEWLNFLVTGVAMQAGTSVVGQSLAADGEINHLGGGQYRVRFSTPGFRYVIGTVTDSAGQVGRVHRPLFIDVHPFQPVELTELRGEVDSGWTMKIVVPSDQPERYAELDPLYPMGLVVLEGLARPVIGWIERWEEKWERGARFLELTARSALSWLGELRCLGVHVEDASSPPSWYFIQGLNVRRAIHHLLEWHSTFNLVENVIFVDSTGELPIKIQQFQDGSVGSALTKLLDDASASAGEQSDGRLAIFRPPVLEWDRNTIPTIEIISGPLRTSAGQELGSLRCGGFAYETPLLSTYPGDVPGPRATKQDKQGLIVTSQDDLNRICGLRWSREKAGDIYITLAEQGDNLEFGRYFLRARPFRCWLRTKAIRAVSGTIETEISGELENIKVAGETTTIPSVPSPSPPEWPSPPYPPIPPFYGDYGPAFLRWSNGVLICRNFYQLSSDAIWERVLWLTGGEITLDFRYVERGTVALVLETDQRILVCLDVNNPTSWQEALNFSEVPEIIGNPNVVDPKPQPFGLITLVQRSNYIGVFVSAGVVGVGTRLYYIFTEDFGKTWQGREVTGHHTAKEKLLFSSLNTAGTDEIIAYACIPEAGRPTEVFRSTSRGYSWQWIGNLTIDTSADRTSIIPFRTRKPWQYGVGGTVVYGTMYGLWTDVAFMKSSNRGVAFQSSLGWGSTGLGLEVWTYDPLRVGLLKFGEDGMDFMLSTDGGQTWQVQPTGVWPPGPESGFLQISHGNPVNKHEWGFISHGSTQQIGNRKFINISLDDGLTWYDRTGNLPQIETWYDGRDYLITPPFRRSE